MAITVRNLTIKGGFQHPPYSQLDPTKARTAMVVVSKGFHNTNVKSR